MSQSSEDTHSTQHATNQLLSLPISNTGNDSAQKDYDRSWWRRPGGITLSILVLLILIIGGLFLYQTTSKHPVILQYQAVQQGDIALTIGATGPLQSTGTYNLTTGTNTTTISEIAVKVGQTVKKGQPLARFDKTPLQDQVAADQADVDGAQATVNSDQLTLDNENYYGAAQAQVLAAQAQLAIAQAQLKTAQVQLAAAQRSLNAATLIAPHSGVVTAINGEVGEMPDGAIASSGSGNSSSSGAGSNFIQIVDLSSLQIQADVNESDMADLQPGDSAQFTVDAYGDQQFTGTVSAISPEGVTSSNVVTYPVIINVDMKSAKGVHLFPNMTADVTITVMQHHNVTLIPVSAINFARQASSGISTTSTPQLISAQDAATATHQAQQILSNLESQNSSLTAQNPIAAFVIENGTKGHSTVKPVVLGLTDGTSYQVLNNALQAGENLIVGVGNSSGGNPTQSSGGGASAKGGLSLPQGQS
jgi:HlyD family secretion protein